MRPMSLARGGFMTAIILGIAVRPPTKTSSLRFTMPKEGGKVVLSETTFVFERESHEDGYPFLYVDGQLIKTYDVMTETYDAVLLGQGVGRHTAVVKLKSLPPEERQENDGDGSEEAEDQREEDNVLHTAQVTYFVAEPGTEDMRGSLSDTCSEGEKEAVAKAQGMIAEALELLPSSQEDSASLLSRAAETEVRSRALRRDLAKALHAYAKLYGSFGGIFGGDDVDGGGGATVDVAGSAGGQEACPGQRQDHELDSLLQSMHRQNPYDGFDGSGLPAFTAGEFQGHDESLMAVLVHVTRPRLIIEVGSWKGGSAIQMGSVVRKRGWGCKTKIVCVDTWLGTATDMLMQRLPVKNGYPTVQREFMRNVIEAGYSSVIIPLAIPANIGAKFLGYLMDRELSPTADLIFIDANHDYDDVKADIANYFPLLSPSGLMFGDDYSWPGVRKAVHEFAERHNLEVFSPNSRTWFMA